MSLDQEWENYLNGDTTDDIFASSNNVPLCRPQ